MQEILKRLAARENLSMEQMSAAIETLMRGEAADEQIAELLTLLHDKGETAQEVAGAAAALRRHMTPIRSQRKGLLDTCGTGGDGSRTFNISTAAALVAAAAGVPVAKHGNRSITSKTGSADVLAELGVNIEADVSAVERCLDELGICFCFAPLLHPAMRHVSAVRKSLGFPTIFNLLGPLSNPAGAEFQLLGVGKAELRPLLAAALSLLGASRAVVVCGADGLDEVTLSGATSVSSVESDAVGDLTWTPADFGLAQADKSSMLVDDPQASAEVIRAVLNGDAGPPRDIVVINAAAALWTARLEPSPQRCAERAAGAIDSGAAVELLRKLAEASHR